MSNPIIGEAYEAFYAWERWMDSQQDSEVVDWDKMDFAARVSIYLLFCRGLKRQTKLL